MPVKYPVLSCLALLLCPVSLAEAKIYQAPLPDTGYNSDNSYNFGSEPGYSAPQARYTAPPGRYSAATVQKHYYDNEQSDYAAPQRHYRNPFRYHRSYKTYATPYNGGGYRYRTHYYSRGNGTYASPLRHDYYYSPATPFKGGGNLTAPPNSPSPYQENSYSASPYPAPPSPTYSPDNNRRIYSAPYEGQNYRHIYP
ncbi:MAG: hypothetical protein DU429_04825 [Candidatus Tokpelaia sp.]|nr:MAG: hypothetical protein DU430_00815 [Candidatus Tokpelaia sp.]KAA6206950.1 MAG: hypothetical protein DU429_04825 [Candidatus Tokpelaia sp.]